MKGDEAIASLGEKQLKQLVMPFAKFKIEEVAKGGAQVGADPGRGGAWQGGRITGSERPFYLQTPCTSNCVLQQLTRG